MHSTTRNLRWARQRFSGLLCLFLFFSMCDSIFAAPLLDCCNSNYCPMQRHHNSENPKASSGTMDCHHDMSATLSCSLSGSHLEMQRSLAPNVFVLTHL